MKHATKRFVLKRFAAIILAVVIATSTMLVPRTVGASATSTFVGNGFTVDFMLISSWSVGYNAQVTMTNNTGQDIHNWRLESNQNLGLASWGATPGNVYAQGADYTIITHQGWNNVFSAGQTIEFWLNGSHNGTAPNPTHFRLMGDGFDSGADSTQPTDPTDAVDPTDGTDPTDALDPTDGTDPTDPTDPTQGTDEVFPYIIIQTQFPQGEVSVSFVDITYTAAPTPGAEIAEIYYRINNGPATYIYISTASRFTQRGDFGQARVFITPQPENHFVFYMRDTAGGVARYVVEEVSTFGLSETPSRYGTFFPPKHDARFREYTPDGRFFYETDRFTFLGVWDYENSQSGVTRCQIDAIVDSVGGTIIGQSLMTGSFTIQLPQPHTSQELYALRDRLLNDYPDIIYSLEISRNHIGGMVDWDGYGSVERYLRLYLDAEKPVGDLYSFLYPINRVDYVVSDERFGNGYPQINSNSGSSDQWAFSAINIYGARDIANSFPAEEKKRVRVGVIDNWFNIDHPSLAVPPSNLRVISDKPSYEYRIHHGNSVTGVLAACHRIGSGVQGVIDINRADIYLHTAYSPEDGAYALEWLVIHGASIINLSMGQHYRTVIDDRMIRLLGIGYDFIVVQPAGNSRGSSDPRFRLLNSDTVLPRVLTVGASTEDRTMRYNSSWGGLVNIAAPGQNILSIGYEDSDRIVYNTSHAVPFVSGVAALAWQVNPGLSGEQLVSILIDSASETDNLIRDTRRCFSWCLGFRCNVPSTVPGLNAYDAVRAAIDFDAAAHQDATLVGKVVDFNRANSTDAFGSAIEGANIRLYTGDSHRNFVTSRVTNQYGFFNISGLEPGRYSMVISRQGYVTMRINFVEINTVGVTTVLNRIIMLGVGTGNVSGNIIAGETIPELYFTPLSNNITADVTLSFTPLYDADGEMIPEADRQAYYTHTTNAGYYDVMLPAGIYQMTATAPGFLPATEIIISCGNNAIDNQHITLYPDPYYTLHRLDVIVLIDNAPMTINPGMDTAQLGAQLASVAIEGLPSAHRVSPQTHGGIIPNVSPVGFTTPTQAIDTMVDFRVNVAHGNFRQIYGDIVVAIGYFLRNSPDYAERVILIMSNGDCATYHPGGQMAMNREQALSIARTQNVTIHAGGVMASNQGVNVLQALASGTGGEYFGPGGQAFANMSGLFARHLATTRITPFVDESTRLENLAELEYWLEYLYNLALMPVEAMEAVQQINPLELPEFAGLEWIFE